MTDGTIAVGTVMERDHSFFSYGTDEVLIGEYPTLAAAVRSGALGAMSVERADGESLHSSPLRDALTAAGFRATPRGLRLRA